MRDLIKRSDAIEQLNEAISICPPCMKGTGIYRTSALEEAIDIINQIPTADRPQGWIPCSERLPSKIGYYLVTTDGSHNSVIDIAEYNDWETGELTWFKASKVLAWMPLPKPWKGADDE